MKKYALFFKHHEPIVEAIVYSKKQDVKQFKKMMDEKYNVTIDKPGDCDESGDDYYSFYDELSIEDLNFIVKNYKHISDIKIIFDVIKK